MLVIERNTVVNRKQKQQKLVDAGYSAGKQGLSIDAFDGHGELERGAWETGWRSGHVLYELTRADEAYDRRRNQMRQDEWERDEQRRTLQNHEEEN